MGIETRRNETISRTEQHEVIMDCIYQYLFYLQNGSRVELKDIFMSTRHLPVSKVEFFIRDTFIKAIKHCQEAVDEISKNLVNWDFDRLGLTEQAVLILGYVEIKIVKLPKAIVINNCVKLAQKFCDDESYKFINGVLDKIDG